MTKFKSFIFSFRLWLIISVLAVSNLFFENGYKDFGFNLFELIITIFSVGMLILTAFFGEKIEKWFF